MKSFPVFSVVFNKKGVIFEREDNTFFIVEKLRIRHMAEFDHTKWGVWIGHGASIAVGVTLLTYGTSMALSAIGVKVPQLPLPGFKSSSVIRELTGPDDEKAIAIGCAEGTRTKDGGKTQAYWHHKDPGDAGNNAGTFSAAPRGNGISSSMSPEERDRKFIQDNINPAIQWAKSNGANINNNREFVAFVDLKVQAHPDVSKNFAMLKESDLLKRRVQAFVFNGKLNAAGLGGTYASVNADQSRRQAAIDKCLGIALYFNPPIA
jgi:hypothetical protein